MPRRVTSWLTNKGILSPEQNIHCPGDDGDKAELKEIITTIDNNMLQTSGLDPDRH
jgi:hypothetical protein